VGGVSQQNFVELLFNIYKDKGFVSTDTVFEVLNSTDMSLDAVDRICDELLSMGVIGGCQPTCRFSGVKVARALPSFSGLSHTACSSSRFLTARPFHLSGCFFLFASSRTAFLPSRIAADSPR